jgi:regulator of sirC expression with transglutaminase-like and TPR domain
VLYVELARRCRRRAEGVGLPGHFIVRVWEADGDVLLDPFNGGVRLSEADCQARLIEHYGAAISFRSEYLRGTPNREILARMLRNLKSAYLGAGDLPRALRAVENLLVVTPRVASEIRDRGLLRMQLGDLSGALVDIRRYLASAPSADEVEPLRATLQRLETLWERRN